MCLCVSLSVGSCVHCLPWRPFNLVRRNVCIGTIADACLPREGVRVLCCETPSSSYQYFLAYHLDSVGHPGMAVADTAKTVC